MRGEVRVEVLVELLVEVLVELRVEVRVELLVVPFSYDSKKNFTSERSELVSYICERPYERSELMRAIHDINNATTRWMDMSHGLLTLPPDKEV